MDHACCITKKTENFNNDSQRHLDKSCVSKKLIKKKPNRY